MGFPDINGILDLVHKVFALEIATLILVTIFGGIGLLLWIMRKK